MKKIFNLFFGIILLLVITSGNVQAVDFDVLVLPTGLFSTCENYFCFPEVSEIAAEDVIYNLNEYNHIRANDLAAIRKSFASNPNLKTKTGVMLENYKKNDKVDFQTLQDIAQTFGVKSILLISDYTITEKSSARRNLWEVLEVSNAFKTSAPYHLITNAVLTDNVNNVIMWSGKYDKNVSDTNGYFLAQNQAQAASQLEKIKQYSKNNISQTISQNIHLRFFPKDVRTFEVNKNNSENQEQETKQFVPNALEHLIKPQMIKELDEGQINTSDPTDDFIFEF